MKSKDIFDGFDLERDLPTTPEDVAALRRVRELSIGLEPWQVVELLVAALPPEARKPRRDTFEGWEPFEL